MSIYLRSLLLLSLIFLSACAQKSDQQANDQAEAPNAVDPVRVLMETSAGNITLELNPGKAPVTVKNFLEYVDSGFYTGTIFHRVIRDFMIQGGGFTADFQKKATRDPIVNEAGNGLSNKRGTIAMARTSNPDSATAQFFINHSDNTSLDRTSFNAGYAVFGKVIDGLYIVDEIAMSRTTSGGPFSKDVPASQVEIISIKRVK